MYMVCTSCKGRWRGRVRWRWVVPLPNALLLIPQNPIAMSHVPVYTDGTLGMEGERKGGRKEEKREGGREAEYR